MISTVIMKLRITAEFHVLLVATRMMPGEREGDETHYTRGIVTSPTTPPPFHSRTSTITSSRLHSSGRRFYETIRGGEGVGCSVSATRFSGVGFDKMLGIEKLVYSSDDKPELKQSMIKALQQKNSTWVVRISKREKGG